MASLDDGISNLQSFIGEATGSANYLMQASGRLEATNTAIEQLEQEAQGDIGETNRVLVEAESELAESRASAVEALEALAQTAEEGADDTLETKRGELEDAGDETEQAAEAARDDLAESYDRLEAEGFRGHADALDDLGAGVENAKNAAERAFEELTDEVSSLSDRGEALGDAVAAGLAETESEVEQEVTVLAGRFDAVKDVWHQSIDEGLRASCDEVGGELQRIYTDWGAAVGEIADELGEDCSTPLDGVSTFVEQQAHQALEEAVGEMLRGPADHLLSEEGLAGAAAEAASVVAEAVGDIVEDLRVSVNVVGQIDRMLNELG
jgi:hypothetical protein